MVEEKLITAKAWLVDFYYTGGQKIEIRNEKYRINDKI